MQTNINRILSAISVAALLVSVTGCEMTTKKPKDERSEGRVLDDKNITSNIRKSFEKEPAYKLDSVHVSTFAGVVALGGFVNTEDQKIRAQQLAQTASGVRGVSNGIVLKPQPTMAPTGGAPRIYAEPAKQPEVIIYEEKVEKPK
jgi:hyperosmotically inducible periplasmic protein